MTGDERESVNRQKAALAREGETVRSGINFSIADRIADDLYE